MFTDADGRRFADETGYEVHDTVWAPPAADLLPYVTSKGALIALARALAMAHGPDGIAVTCVTPGLTDTPAARAGLPAAAFDAVRARQTLPRALRPDDVAATVAFLASDDAARAYRPGAVHRRRPGHALNFVPRCLCFKHCASAGFMIAKGLIQPY